LDLNDFVNLEELRCYYNQYVTSLNLDNCKKLKELDCSYNELTELKVNHLSELTTLFCSNNQLTDLDLSNNSLHGSLEPLKGMSKLEILDIRDTDLDSGLEYLPESVWIFYCSA